MRIAFFTDTYLPNVDGVVNSIVETRKQLERRGHEVFIFTSGTEKDRLANADARAYYFRSIRFPPYPQYKVALFPFLSAASLVKKNKVQLVHSHAMASMGLAARRAASVAGLPLVGTFHTFLPSPSITGYVTKSQLGRKLASTVLWKAIALFYKPFDVVTAPSRVTARLLEEHGVHNTIVLPNGIDTKFFSPRDREVVRRLLGLEDEKMVLVAGRLGWEKNVDVVVKAAKHVLREQKTRFVVTGEGPAKEHCMALAAKEGVLRAFEFEGFVNKKALPHYYSAADCVVSASAFETQGLSLLEAQACGTPCVGAGTMAIPEVIEEGKTGLLFEPFDAGDCADKILEVVCAPERRKRAWRENARKNALRYSIERTSDRVIALYESLLD